MGEYFPPSPAFQSCLWKRVPPVSSLSGSVPSRHRFWCCSDLLPGFSPIFDRTETLFGEIFSTFASLPELSLEAPPPREFSLGFGTIKASSWRCSGLLQGVSSVFDRTRLFMGKYFAPSPSFQSCLWKRVPPVSSLSGSVPSRHLFRAVGKSERIQPFEHPSVREGRKSKCQKRLGGIIGCKNDPIHGIQTGSPMIVTLGQQYDTLRYAVHLY